MLAFDASSLLLARDNYPPFNFPSVWTWIDDLVVSNGIAMSELVSDEAVQVSLPQNTRKYKSPAVCAKPEVGVGCINFVGFFKRSNMVFG